MRGTPRALAICINAVSNAAITVRYLMDLKKQLELALTRARTLKTKLEPVTVCADCGEQVSGISAGDEGWTYCEGCNQVEGRTVEITTEEYEARS